VLDTNSKTQVKKKKKTFDILMGVGAKYYPDPSFFIEETLRLGLNKRIHQAPEFFNPRKNALWLVHWGTGQIFGLVIGLKYRIFAEPSSEECRKAMKELGPENVICAPLGALPGDSAERGCGRMRGGGMYAKQT